MEENGNAELLKLINKHIDGRFNPFEDRVNNKIKSLELGQERTNVLLHMLSEDILSIDKRFSVLSLEIKANQKEMRELITEKLK